MYTSLNVADCASVVEWLGGTLLWHMAPVVSEKKLAGKDLLTMSAEKMRKVFSCKEEDAEMFVELVESHESMIKLCDQLRKDRFVWKEWKSMGNLFCIANMNSEYLSKMLELKLETTELLQKVLEKEIEQRVLANAARNANKTRGNKE
jgi:hypothetical protein